MVTPTESQKTFSDLCVEILRNCQERLVEPNSLEDEELVHNLRVATKRLRAAWHLVKELSGPELARDRRNALKELSAHLSFRRDAAVLEELTRQLASAQSETEIAFYFEAIGDSIRQQPRHSQKQPCPDGLFEEVRDCLDEEIAAWESIDWNSPGHGRKAIRRALHKVRSQARKKTREALADNGAEVWHEWRKAIKRLRYQREFVALASSRFPGKFDARISRLGTALGLRNDLANLVEYLEQEKRAGRLEKIAMKHLRPAIGIAERDLLRNCRRLGRKFLAK